MEKECRAISFAAFGPVNPEEINLLAGRAGELLMVPTKVNQPLLQVPADIYNSQRRQYHAGMVLNYLADQYTDFLRIVGITSHDLFLPIFTHVYGEAQMPGRAAVVSLFRLNPADAVPLDEHQIVARALKVAVHELLHTFELTHCLHSDCLMQPVTSVAQLDALPPKLCRSCRNFWEDIAGRLHLKRLP